MMGRLHPGRRNLDLAFVLQMWAEPCSFSMLGQRSARLPEPASGYLPASCLSEPCVCTVPVCLTTLPHRTPETSRFSVDVCAMKGRVLRSIAQSARSPCLGRSFSQDARRCLHEGRLFVCRLANSRRIKVRIHRHGLLVNLISLCPLLGRRSKMEDKHVCIEDLNALMGLEVRTHARAGC